MCGCREVTSGPAATYNVDTERKTCFNQNANYRIHKREDVLVPDLSALSLDQQPPNKTYLEKQCDGLSTCLQQEAESASLIHAVIPSAKKSVDARKFSHFLRLRSESASNDQYKRGADVFWTACRTLDVVSEDRAWEDQCVQELDSSLSLLVTETSGDSCSPTDFQVRDDFDVQGHLCGSSAEHFSSFEGLSHPRKGLSRCYAGKSRSFSCLRDVTSVKDLAKADNPHARKQKRLRGCNSSLQSTAREIGKKSSKSSRCTLYLGIAMGVENSESAGSWQSSYAAARSYSLSDLQAHPGSYFS